MRKQESWTESSVECYKNDCICSEKCKNYEICQRIAKNTVDGQPPIKKAVDQMLSNGVAIPLAIAGELTFGLSETDAKILKLWIADGKSNQRMMKELNLSSRAIKAHKTKIYDTFSYSFAGPKRLFKDYAKQELLPEIDRMERLGCLC